MSTNNNSVPDFAARFAAASTQSLVEEFNRQVGSNAWTSARAVHDQALIAELQGRGIRQKPLQHYRRKHPFRPP